MGAVSLPDTTFVSDDLSITEPMFATSNYTQYAPSDNIKSFQEWISECTGYVDNSKNFFFTSSLKEIFLKFLLILIVLQYNTLARFLFSPSVNCGCLLYYTNYHVLKKIHREGIRFSNFYFLTVSSYGRGNDMSNPRAAIEPVGPQITKVMLSINIPNIYASVS